jgi:hypothetical protein
LFDAEKLYIDDLNQLETQSITWSDILYHNQMAFVYIATGNKKGSITFLGFDVSGFQKNPKISINRQFFVLSGKIDVKDTWITAMTWKNFSIDSKIQSFLFIGTSDGHIRIFNCILEERLDGIIPLINCTLSFSMENYLNSPITCIACPQPFVRNYLK